MTRFAPTFSLFFVFCFSAMTVAQQVSDSSTSADLLRARIEQLEKSELNSRSTTVQDIYKRTLVRLYGEFSKALETDIADLKKIEASVRGTQSESNGEVAAELHRLIIERDVVNEKLKTIGAVSGQSDLKFSPASRSMLASTAPEALLRNQQETDRPGPSRSSAGEVFARVNSDGAIVNAVAATPPPVLPDPVTGTVTIKNDGNTFNARGAKVVLSKVAENGARTAAAETVTGTNGVYSIALPAGATGQYVVTASLADYSVEIPVSNNNDIEVLVRPMGEFSRAIVGFEQAGASSAQSTQRFFMDLTLSAPLPWGKPDPFFGRRARSWGSARITSVPQQVTTGVAEFAGAFAQKVGEVKVNELAHGVEFLAGGEYRITGSGPSRFGSFGAKTSTRFSLSFIVGGGVITPFNPRDTLEIFKVFPGAPSLPPVPDGKEFIAFVSPDRDRFFRQYYGGFRLQTYYFDYLNPDVPIKRYPATLDITYGQNEAVTGGRLRGGVIRLEGFYPLPYEGMKFINLFGTALIKPARTQITDPLILEAAPAGTTVPANNVFLRTVPQINRDYYKIGVGIDFISLISKWRAASH